MLRDRVLHQLCQAHFKQEEEGKFRCLECTKLFSTMHYISKHISVKHPDVLGDAPAKVAFLNNYALDPARLSFSADHPPPAHNGRMSNSNPPPMSIMHLGVGMGQGMPQRPQFQHMSPPAHSFGGAGGMGQSDRRQMGMGGLQSDDRRGVPRMRDSRDDRDGRERRNGPPPPPPSGAKLDPRAGKGGRSYADLVSLSDALSLTRISADLTPSLCRTTRRLGPTR